MTAEPRRRGKERDKKERDRGGKDDEEVEDSKLIGFLNFHFLSKLILLNGYLFI